jgi:glyoxylase-like metal-dependent hydrolase (beta-lactamase superfamily II)
MFQVDVLTNIMPNLYAPRPAFLPVNCVLLRYDGHLALVDTGMVGDSALSERLRAQGIVPEDVDLVITTHVHPDHVGSHRLFGRARIIASRVDYEFQKSFAHEIIDAPEPETVVAKYYPHLHERQIAQFAPSMARMCRLYWQDDNVGDEVDWTEEAKEIAPGLRLIATPGHTFNHFSVLVQGKEDQVLIAGDAIPSRVFFRSQLRTAIAHVDPIAQEVSRRRLDTFQGIIIPGHDRPFYSETRKQLGSDSFAV